MEFKVGDRVRCVPQERAKKSIAAGYQPDLEFIINHIENTSSGICCFGGYGNSGVYEEDLILIERSESMSKYTELKQRIEGLKNGWDKEADDILQEITYSDTEKDASRPYYLLIEMNNSHSVCGYIEIKNGKGRETLATFEFKDQCEKMTAFKNALLWLLDHSDIKKDEKQEKIAELKKEIEELNRKIEELANGK